MRFEHRLLGFSLELPDGWRAMAEVPPTFVAPDDDARSFAPNVVVTTGEPADPAVVADELAGGWLIDAGRDHALLHHLERGVPTVLEQWWTVRDGRAWVVSASCAPQDYDALADQFDAIAGSLTIA
jgi:hypothetical protein